MKKIIIFLAILGRFLLSPCGILLLTVSVVCSPFLFTGKVIFWGVPLLQFYPWHAIAKETVLRGFLPLWNPHLGMGAPLLANAQSAILYPPNWLLLAVPVEYGQGWLLAAHLFFAGWGMARLMRALGVRSFGQTIAALSFALSGYVFARSWFLSINASVAWLPWIVLAGERLLAKPNGRSILMLSFALALQWLAGHWQTAFYTGIFLVGWISFRAATRKPLGKSLLGAWFVLACAVLIAVCLTAVQLLPTVEYWQYSQRAGGFDPATGFTYSLWPWQLIGFLAPYFFGSPVSGNYWGYANYWEMAAYIGFLPILLAISILVRKVFRKRDSQMPFEYLLLAILFSIVLGLGTWTPLFSILEQSSFSIRLFQAPARVLLLAVAACAILAGAGADAWERYAGDRSRSGIVAVSFLAIFLGGLIGPMVAPFPPSFGASIAIVGAIGFVASLMHRFADHPALNYRGRRFWIAGAIVLVAVDLLIADWGLVPAGNAEPYQPTTRGMQIAQKLSGKRMYMPEPVRYDLTYNHFLRFETFSAVDNWQEMRNYLLPNVSVLDGIESANNFDPFVPARYAAFITKLDSSSVEDQVRLMRMMNIGAYWPDSAAWRTAEPPLGPMWAVCLAEWVTSDEEALSTVSESAFDPGATVVLETGKGSEGSVCASPMVVREAMGDDPNRVDAEAKFGQAGFLILADVNFPGWRAYVDGEEAPLLQADYAFRAVRVPAGAHAISFQYQPLSFWMGFWITSATLLVMGVCVMWNSIRSFRKK